MEDSLIEDEVLVTQDNITRLTEMLRKGLIKSFGRLNFRNHLMWRFVKGYQCDTLELREGDWIEYCDNLLSINDFERRNNLHANN